VAQQRQLAEVEHHMYQEDTTMMHQSNGNGSYAPRYATDAEMSEGQKTSGVVISRSNVAKLSKSPARTDAPRDWLGGAGSFAAGSELSRSAPGPNYI